MRNNGLYVSDLHGSDFRGSAKGIGELASFSLVLHPNIVKEHLMQQDDEVVNGKVNSEFRHKGVQKGR